MDEFERQSRETMNHRLMEIATATSNWQEIPKNLLPWFLETARRREIHFIRYPELSTLVTKFRDYLQEYSVVQAQRHHAYAETTDEALRAQANQKKRELELKYGPSAGWVREFEKLLAPYLEDQRG